VTETARRPGRRPGPTETRAAILAAARDLFAEKGYDGASLRGIARAAGVDPALLHHFFGSKEGVFVAAMRFPLDPGELVPQIADVPRGRLGESLARLLLGVWDDPERRAPLVAMLRSAMTNERVAASVREFLSAELFGPVMAAHGVPALRLDAAAAQLLGLMVLRHVLRLEPLASADTEDLVALVGPVLQGYLG
jgi:AcrR family transcriptional regulator